MPTLPSCYASTITTHYSCCWPLFPVNSRTIGLPSSSSSSYYYGCGGAFNRLSVRVQKQQQQQQTRRVTKIKCAAAVREIDEAQFSDVVLKSDLPVLVEFVATWCGPCRLIAPAVQSLAQEYQDKLVIVKIDHDSNPRLIEEYKVYGLPTLILFQKGQEVPESRREGAITKAKLKDYVDKLLEYVSPV